MIVLDQFHREAEFLRESSGSTNIENTLLRALRVTDRETKVEVDLLAGGMPMHVSEKPQILTLEKLISAKLSTYIGMGIHRAQDYADVCCTGQSQPHKAGSRRRSEGPGTIPGDLGWP